MTLYDRIRLRREELGMSQEDLANKLGYKSRSTINKIELGINDITQSKIASFAKALDVTPAWLMGWEENQNMQNNSQKTTDKYPELIPVETKKIPLLGEIACGKPIFTNEEYEVFVDAATDIQADFALKACGDSMINARINDGDIVFIREQPDVNNGEIAAVAIDDEVTLKRVYRQENSITLVAENPVYAPLVYTQQSAVTIHILGKAVAFQSSL